MTTEQDETETPVLFRIHRSPKKYGDDVTAVFPCEPHDMSGHTMTCYAHVGQHSGCNLGWYYDTRPAKPEEYADLARELESAPYGYKLKIYQRMNVKLRNAFNGGVRRLNARKIA